MAGAEERLRPPPGVAAVGGYVIANGLWCPISGASVGDGSATLSVTGVPNEAGTWDYRAGASGSPRSFAGRVIGIAAHAPTSAGGSVTINGGDAIPVPAGAGIELAPRGNVVSPTIVFTGTDSYMVELVS